MRVWVLLLVASALGAMALAGAEQEVLANLDVRDVLIAAGLVLGVAGIGLAFSTPSPAPSAARPMRAAVLLASLTGLLVAGYNYRLELITALHAVAPELTLSVMTPRVESDPGDDQSVRIRRRPDGHFLAGAQVNGLAMTLLVDTGASTVVLKPADAKSLGIDMDRLRFTIPVQTANGTTYAAAVRLRSLSVGGIRIDGVDALISKPGALKDSLLGMTFLNRLRSYEFSGDLLTLRL